MLASSNVTSRPSIPQSARPQFSRTSTIVNQTGTKLDENGNPDSMDVFMDREFVIGETFEEWLDKGNVDKALRRVLISLTEIAFKEISEKIKEASTNK
jgi:hypothetical protein